MSETVFPINDLLRRKLQTSLAIFSLTLCVASTLFLLLFSQKIGFGILSIGEGRLTQGFLLVFSQFIIFVAILIFIAGAVVISFIVFVMMSQRVRDIGLIKATGCPNDLIFGYFMTELLVVALTGCFLGVLLGLLFDFVGTTVFLNSFQVLLEPTNFWLLPVVFVSFLAVSLIFGAKPILDATKMEPARALSLINYYSMNKSNEFKAMPKTRLLFRMALRSLFRRKSATVRIILCLTVVFILVTVTVAGGLIADQTTKNWVEQATGRDVVLVAHRSLCSQYELLLSKFQGATEGSEFNYSEAKFLVSDEMLSQLQSIQGIFHIETRLVLKMQASEIRNYTFNPTTGATIPVGDDREGESLIVGVEPEKVLGKCLLQGRFLQEEGNWEAVIGDSLAQKMFSLPLSQGIRLHDSDFTIVGVCLDPINNGNVTYVPLQTLQNVSGISKPNVILVKIDPSINRTQILNQIVGKIRNVNPDFDACDINEVLDKNLAYLGYIWSTIMILPLFSLASASLCLIAYAILTISEQGQEFGVLRALGAKPSAVIEIISVQNLTILLSSYGVGIAFGIITILMILVPNPIVTGYTILEIAGWLLMSLGLIFILSLYPAVKLSRKPILEIMA